MLPAKAREAVDEIADFPWVEVSMLLWQLGGYLDLLMGYCLNTRGKMGDLFLAPMFLPICSFCVYRIVYGEK